MLFHYSLRACECHVSSMSANVPCKRFQTKIFISLLRGIYFILFYYLFSFFFAQLPCKRRRRRGVTINTFSRIEMRNGADEVDMLRGRQKRLEREIEAIRGARAKNRQSDGDECSSDEDDGSAYSEPHSPLRSLPTSRRRDASSSASPVRKGGSPSSSGRARAGKLESLMKYLEDAEERTDLTSARSFATSSRKAAGQVGQTSAAPSEFKFEWENQKVPASARSHFSSRTGASTSTVYNGVKAKLMGMTLELEDKTRTVTALREALKSARSERESLVEKATSRADEHIEKMKSEHSSAMERNLGFIDKLLVDKKGLSAKVEELTAQLNQAKTKWKQKHQSMDAKHRIELQRARESLAASEKAKREKWEKQKARELKEITIKGLEPEIQRILEKHKKDVRALEDHYQGELRRQRETLLKQHERTLREARMKAEEEHRQTIATERAASHDREKELLGRHREELSMRRASVGKEIEEMDSRHGREMNALKQKFADELDDTKAKMRLESQDECAKLEKALASRERQWAVEKEQWQARLVAKLHEKSQREESAARERFASQRDRQIEMVISRLTEERAEEERRARDEHEKEIDDLRARHEMELAEARDAQDAWMQKHAAIRNETEGKERSQRNMESRLAQMENQASQRERKIAELRQIVAQRDDAIMESEERVREEYASRLSTLAQKVRAAEAKTTAAAASHRTEADALRAAHESELDDIHQRVRAAMSKKDAIIDALTERAEEAEMRVQHNLVLLENQRRDLLRED